MAQDIAGYVGFVVFVVAFLAVYSEANNSIAQRRHDHGNAMAALIVALLVAVPIYFAIRLLDFVVSLLAGPLGIALIVVVAAGGITAYLVGQSRMQREDVDTTLHLKAPEEIAILKAEFDGAPIDDAGLCARCAGTGYVPLGTGLQGTAEADRCTCPIGKQRDVPSPPKRRTSACVRPTEPENKTCPVCAETVKFKAVVCRFCRHEFG